MRRWSRDSASFRDPGGFVFTLDGILYRQVNETFGATYDRLIDSGLYAELTEADLMLDHEEVALRLDGAPTPRAILRPRLVPFISYPYEWCHGQLKAAALLTLELQKRAVARGLVLRDASAYNVQFVAGRPLFIDTLSFGSLVDGEPWGAYRQFCQHFVAPLALMSHVDASLAGLLRSHLDGIPLPLAARQLPLSTRFRPGLLTHLHLHARSIVRRSDPKPAADRAGTRRPRMTRTALLGLIDSLEGTVRGLTYRSAEDSLGRLLRAYELLSVGRAAQTGSGCPDDWDGAGAPADRHDLGSRREYRRLQPGGRRVGRACGQFRFRCRGRRAALSRLRRARRNAGVAAHSGSHQSERGNRVEVPGAAFTRRPRPRRSLLALALIHHLAIGNNLPLDEIAQFLRSISRMLILEFVPKEDSQVQRMLSVREDIFRIIASRRSRPPFRRSSGCSNGSPSPIPAARSIRSRGYDAEAAAP